MHVLIHASKDELARQAAAEAIEVLESVLVDRARARIVLASGKSQIDMLAQLAAAPLPWRRVEIFHLDEYPDVPADHPASFRRFLRERFLERLREPPACFVAINAESPDPQAECDRLGGIIGTRHADLAMIGIGENGHLAFNDPPADFEAAEAYRVVELDDDCRRQQVGEGWFASLDEAPRRAISMTIPQILSAHHIVCSVPERRKAAAVARAVNGAVTPSTPASALQQHVNTSIHLDPESASLL